MDLNIFEKESIVYKAFFIELDKDTWMVLLALFIGRFAVCAFAMKDKYW